MITSRGNIVIHEVFSSVLVFPASVKCRPEAWHSVQTNAECMQAQHILDRDGTDKRKNAPVMLMLLPEVTAMGVVWTPTIRLLMKLMLLWSE